MRADLPRTQRPDRPGRTPARPAAAAAPRGLLSARELHLQGRYEDSLVRLDSLLAPDTVDTVPADTARDAALLRAWCLIERKDHDGAVAWLGEAVDRSLVADDDLEVRILRWNVLLFHEKYAEVEAAVIETLPTVADEPSAEHAELRLLLGAALRWRGRLQDALAHVEYACSVFTVLAEPGRCAVAANFLGWTCLSLGRFDESRRWFEKALDLNRSLGSALRMAQNYQNLAIVCYKRGEYATAEDILVRELELVDGRDDMIARARIALGNVHRLQGRLESARGELMTGWDHAVTAGLAREQALALEYLGDVQRDDGRPAEARAYYARAMTIAEVLAPRGDLVMELRRREGECLDLEGRHDEALAVLDEAAVLCEEVGDAYEAAVTLRCQAANAAHLGRWARALELNDDATGRLESLHARHERLIAAWQGAHLRLRWADTATGTSRASRLVDEAWNLALTAHRLDDDLEGTLLRENCGELVNELARRRLARRSPERGGGRPFTARHAPASRIIAASEAMRRVLCRCDGFTGYEEPVLIVGENGSGKELLARRLHENSPRSAGPFCRLDCSAAPATDLAREFFGSEDGRESDTGLLGRAQSGTLLLTGVENLSEALQERLMVTIRDGSWRPLGSAREREADVRIVAATAADLGALATAGDFRPDLYYRLRLMTVTVPPLRVRQEDVLALLDHFLTRLEGVPLTARKVFDAPTLQVLTTHAWPGNAAEVESVAQQAWLHRQLGQPRLLHPATDEGGALVFAAAAEAAGTADGDSGLTWDSLNAMIGRASGNKARVARQLGVSRATLYRWLSQLEPEGG